MTTSVDENLAITDLTELRSSRARFQLKKEPGRGSRIVLSLGAVVLVLVVWQLLSLSGILPAQSFPSAAASLAALGGLLVSSGFWLAIWGTTWPALVGLVILLVVASALAIAIGASRFMENSTWFLVEFLKPIPPVALIPLGLLLYGPGSYLKILLVVFGAIWPLLTQLVYGVKNVDTATVDMARSYRFTRFQIARYVVAPAVLPYALTGLRVSSAIAVIIAVVTEMVGGTFGIGQSIVLAQSANDLPRMYALIIATGLLGLGINSLFWALEKPLLFWHASQRQEVG